MAIEEYIRDIELAVNAKDMRKPIADAFRELDNQFEDLEIDEIPTANSNNLVESGGVYDLWNQVIDTNELILPTDEYISGEKVLTEQGTYEASDDHLDGYSKVIADQSLGKLDANLQPKFIYMDGEYNPENDNCDGYSLIIADLGANDLFSHIIERTLSGSVTLTNIPTIGSYAFCDCSLLESIEGNTCSKIADYAFASCISLQNAIFSHCTKLGDNVFADCCQLENVVLGYADCFPSYAFYNCQKLEYVNINDSSHLSVIDASSIGDYAFYNCNNLRCFTGDLYSHYYNYYNPADPHSYDRTLLRTIVRDDIGKYAFCNCFNFNGCITVDIRDNDTKSTYHIGEYAFCNCYNLEYSQRSTYSAYINIFLTSTAISENGTASLADTNRTLFIDKYAFKNCYKLSSINIRTNNLHIEEYAFENCSQMGFSFLGPLHVTIESHAFNSASVWFGGYNGVGDNRTIVFHSIGKYAFQSCTACPTNIYGPSDSLCVIDEYAYDGCHCSRADLSNTEVMSMAFANCSQLSHVTFYSAIILHNNAFVNCINLNDMRIEVDASNFSFEENAFDGTPFNDYNSASTTVVPRIGIYIGNWPSYYTDPKWSRYLSFFYSWRY